MLLSRRIERGLHDGASIAVERAWQIDFSNQGNGYAVTGRQVSARVEAPAALSALARIEESRSTDGMFPILLSASGLVVAAGRYTRDHDIDAAVREAKSVIGGWAIPADAKLMQLQYLAQLQRSAGSMLEKLPADLFFPGPAPARSVQTVDLPEGLKGEFEVTYEARRAPGGAWLEHAVRRVITRIGESERRSSEVWTMGEF
ncbi:hypothetical protein [Erythrobacter sp. JK5]|uniref:hypothetical protein n=1 Tax=Erythrobacter sp. JK5 TaxID=2829500 RepID=UPI001BA4C2A1|nr:hypothetical protein [Erythrobacter sp. JK5]QUL37248.1 hypothetical protein KDC96_12825 [Erythrobacter sp. JK5]